MNIKKKAVLATAGTMVAAIGIALGLAFAGQYIFPVLIAGFMAIAVYCTYRAFLTSFEIDRKIEEIVDSERRKT